MQISIGEHYKTNVQARNIYGGKFSKRAPLANRVFFPFLPTQSPHTEKRAPSRRNAQIWSSQKKPNFLLVCLIFRFSLLVANSSIFAQILLIFFCRFCQLKIDFKKFDVKHLISGKMLPSKIFSCDRRVFVCVWFAQFSQ